MINRLIEWLGESTCNFLAADVVCRELDAAGFVRLDKGEEWNLIAGGKYYLTKNDSAVFAFVCGQKPMADGGVHIISSHSDSPCFKIKPNAEIYGDGGVVSLNVEKYGGGILYTWFDRPLSISGRVLTAGEDPLHPVAHLVDLKRAMASIPHLAIHFNRGLNEGNPLSVQKDMKPVVGYFTPEEIADYKAHGGVVKSLLADEIGVGPEEILSYELCLYPVEQPTLSGVREEYLQSGRIDDLSMAFASLQAMLDTCDQESDATRVMAIFDNEETGSGTKQGAHSPILKDVLLRVAGGETELSRGVAKGFMISADDAHAWHPNYNEKYDPTNHPVIGGGPVIKINANCKYMTDAVGDAVFAALCKECGVGYQYFVNHSDVAGGSTLGNILTAQLDIAGVDMGAPIWAMHSACETAGVDDHVDIVKVFSHFYSK